MTFDFWRLREEFKIEGIMPERALLRLRRAGIALYNVKKTAKNVLLFRVKKKDVEKVFAIYPKVCYNGTNGYPYRLTKVGAAGVGKWIVFFKNRAAIVLGLLAFCGLTLAADNLVFGVEFIGSTVYAREAQMALAESGIKSFAPYPKGKEDIVTAKLLSLHGVEFCSVQKKGSWVRVEMQIDPFTTQALQKTGLTAAEGGEIRSISVLRGTALKKAGDTVEKGEELVGNWFVKEDGVRIAVEPVARVQIVCAYAELQEGAATEEEAFAQAYLRILATGSEDIIQRKITQTEKGFFVEISYLVTQRVNL